MDVKNSRYCKLMSRILTQHNIFPEKIIVKKITYLIITVLITLNVASATENFTIARLRYSGGGDWYNDPSVIPNLLNKLNEVTNIKTAEEQEIVSFKDNKILDYPITYLTGHGNVTFNNEEQENIRNYLKKGGFLYIDDDYGMDEHIRKELRNIFPNKNLQELPAAHSLFDCFYKFNNGLPKIHKHDGKRPQAFALFNEFGRMIVLYTYETNISDGWASPNVHKDPPEIREKALKMGVNIVYYVLTH